MRLAILLLLQSFALIAQQGTYIGSCYNSYHKYGSDVLMSVTFVGGNQYNIKAIETSKFGTVSWSVNFFASSTRAFVLRKNVKILHPKKFAEYKLSACLCEDNLDLILGTNTTFNYVEAACTVNAISWDLRGFHTLSPLLALKQTKLKPCLRLP